MADANPPRPSPPPLDDACALFLDVDGTLVEFSDDPAAVRVLPQVLEAIGAISDRLGGAVALGHPVGATGAIITVKALHELERSGGKTALVTMCIGGGQGIALAIERV